MLNNTIKFYILVLQVTTIIYHYMKKNIIKNKENTIKYGELKNLAKAILKDNLYRLIKNFKKIIDGNLLYQ